ncbi:MAG: SDR family NAD(P)-dependent oxidoreductase [Actinomycetota bacterium]
MTDFSNRSALVTGATSGLGMEAAAQLAEQGYGAVTITGRSDAKAETARRQLVERTGRDVFTTLAVDVADLASSRGAADELVGRNGRFDTVILNAGMVPAKLERSPDGIEQAFAASIVGHHVLTEALAEAGQIDGASVVIVGSEAANDDLPKMMGFGIYDFAKGEPSPFGATPAEAMRAFATASGDVAYSGERQYSTTKVFSAWWAAGMARRHPNTRFYNVSPGANLGTDAARHLTGATKIMMAVMGKIGRFVGMDQPVHKGAKRYLDVAHGVDGPYQNGSTYTSKPKRMTGSIVRRTEDHLVDTARQDLGLQIIDELTGVRV